MLAHRVRLLTVYGGAALLVVASCGGDAAAPIPTSTSVDSAATSAPALVTESTTFTVTAPSAPDSVPGTATPDDGWSLVVDAPAANTSVPVPLTVCYLATGPTREPALELNVEAAPRNGGASATATVAITPGRGAAMVDLGSAVSGLVDLRVELVLDGVPVAGAAALIEGVSLTPGAPPPVCA